jgi:hypothetical protein
VCCVVFVSGVAQGVITGIRGLCNGLGPALFGFIFFLFHVDLEKSNEVTPSVKGLNVTSQVDRSVDGILRHFNAVILSELHLLSTLGRNDSSGLSYRSMPSFM